jgi:MFS family permease
VRARQSAWRIAEARFGATINTFGARHAAGRLLDAVARPSHRERVATPRSPSTTEAFMLPKHADDVSGHLHRKFIGAAGALLPMLIIVFAARRPTDGLTPGEILGSVSAYYYSGAVVMFVGTLIALAVFMFTYKGYKNEWYNLDRRTALVAGVAAAIVAFYPATPPIPELEPSWWTPRHGKFHYVAAITLFSCFAFYCLVLFRKTAPGTATTKDKDIRNKLYVFAGIGIIACMVWAGWNGWKKESIFIPEAIALELFAFSWLVKGRIDYNIRNPLQSAKDVMKAAKG